MNCSKALPLILCAFFSAACPGKIDAITLNRILPAAMERGNIDEACAMGTSLSPVIYALGTQNRQPDRALAITGVAGAICAVKQAQEADLNEAALRALWIGNPKGLDALTDARIVKQRAHTAAAVRFGEVWSAFEKLYPKVHERCPKLKSREEPVFLVGVLSGLLAVLHDGAGGRNANISQDIVLKASRAAQCLNNTRWWNVPDAMLVGGWATIPGSGPKNIDPWAKLQELSAEADDQGMRLTSALYVTIAANAGKSEESKAGIRHAADSFNNTDVVSEWRLLDELAYLLLRHESDLLWFSETGHRTETLGTFPQAEKPEIETANPFADDEDPFGSE